MSRHCPRSMKPTASEPTYGGLFSLFLFVFVDILGFALVLPLFPYLTSQFGLTSTQVGLLQASNALSQLFAVPVIGSLSDRLGRRPLLLICVFGTFVRICSFNISPIFKLTSQVSFLILAAANSPFWLFFSRILDGLLGGNISLAQAYVSGVYLVKRTKIPPPLLELAPSHSVRRHK